MSVNEEFVQLNSRFTGAWLEYNARLGARYQIISMWIVLSTALLGTYAQFGAEGSKILLHYLIGVALAFNAWAMFQLLFMQDAQLARLYLFMSACERHGNARDRGKVGGQEHPLPCYHSDAEYGGSVVAVRSIQNFTLNIALFALGLGQLIVDWWAIVMAPWPIDRLFDLFSQPHHPLWRISVFAVSIYLYVVAWRVNKAAVQIRKLERGLVYGNVCSSNPGAYLQSEIRRAYLGTIPFVFRPFVGAWWSKASEEEPWERTGENGPTPGRS